MRISQKRIQKRFRAKFAWRAKRELERQNTEKQEPKCGAFARSTGKPCRMKALANGRCRLHGGLSTGPKTQEGREKAIANLKQFASTVKSEKEFDISCT